MSIAETTRPDVASKGNQQGGFSISLSLALSRLRAIHERYRTQQALDAMPADLRKDIGWPATDMRHHAAQV